MMYTAYITKLLELETREFHVCSFVLKLCDTGEQLHVYILAWKQKTYKGFGARKFFYLTTCKEKKEKL